MWFNYLLLCIDESLYCGVTTDLARRTHEHNYSAKGAKYTKARRPVELVYWEEHQSRSQACKREAEIKKLPRAQKVALIQQFAKNNRRH